MNVSAY
jgi:hypothetical protein